MNQPVQLQSLAYKRRNLEHSPLRDKPEYAALLVYHELYGGRSNIEIYKKETAVMWITCPTMAIHDQITQYLRQLHISYRTEKQKTRFTTFFQALPDTFLSYTPKDQPCAQALLSQWKQNTEPHYQDKYITRLQEQARVLQRCLSVMGWKYRTISRPVRWGGLSIVDGYMILSEIPKVKSAGPLPVREVIKDRSDQNISSLVDSWLYDKEKVLVNDVLHKITGH